MQKSSARVAIPASAFDAEGRCAKCRRSLRSDVSLRKHYGRDCWSRIDAACRILRASRDHRAGKAIQALKDAKFKPTAAHNVWRSLSSDGTTTYLTSPDLCGCPAGQHELLCYHRVAVKILAA